MLTIDATTLTPNIPHTVFVLEFDMEYANLQTFGQAKITRSEKSYLGMDELESAKTGGVYGCPSANGNVELWTAEEHYLAIFPNEAAMRKGATQIVKQWGDELPVGLYRALTA